MKTFRFYQDVKVERTYREYYNIQAESLEDARAKAEQAANLRDCEDAEFDEGEDLFSTIDDMYEYQNPNIVGIYDSEGEEI